MALFTRQSLGSLTENIGGAIDAYGVAQKRQSLANLGTQLQAGDYPEAAKVAFQSGDVTTGLKILEIGRLREGDKKRESLYETNPSIAPQASSAPAEQAPAISRSAAGGVPADFLPFYQRASAETGIPAGVLMAQHRQESNFDPNAVSKTGAIGVGQVLPSTARDPGYGVAPIAEADLRDPEKNILFSARYLKARGNALGQTDFSTPTKAAAALKAYVGDSDPNYVQKIERNFAGGQQSAPLDQVAASGGFVPRETVRPAQPGQPAQAVQNQDANRSALIAYRSRLARGMAGQDEAGRASIKAEIDNVNNSLKALDIVPFATRSASIQDYEYGRANPEFARAQEAKRAKETSYGVIGRDEFGEPVSGYRPSREEYAAQQAAQQAARQGAPATAPQGKIARENAQREAEATRLGLQGEDRIQYITSGRVTRASDKVTEGQVRANMLEKSARNANELLNSPDFIGGGLGLTGARGAASADIPIVGSFITPEKYKQFRQAGEEFAQSILYLRSGAAAPAAEVEKTIREFTPQPGDGPDQIKQIAKSREVALEGALEASSKRAGITSGANKPTGEHKIGETKVINGISIKRLQ